MNVRHLLSLTIGLSLCVGMLQAGQGGPGNGGVAVNANAVMGDIQRLVGEEVCFTLTAKDDNGNVIRSWDQIGNPVTLTLNNTDANTDSSAQSWSADPEGYSWARLTFNGVELTKISPNEWTIPNTDFFEGVAEVCLTCSKADTSVFITVTPTFGTLNQVSQSIDYLADEITNYLVDITSATAPDDGVYLLRPYELIVAPRDRFLNISDKTIRTRFSARFPGEFDQQQPGLADIFSGEVFIKGLTNYLIASRIIREKPVEPQYIMAYGSIDHTIQGVTDPFEVLSHAPVPFRLLTPPDHFIMNLMTSVDLQDFTWERPTPPDPYWDIQVSRFDPVRVSDEVRYTWVLIDSASLTNEYRIASNNNGIEPELTLTHGQLWGLLKSISGQQSTRSYQCVWYVEATDGLFITQSDPIPGHHITLVADGISAIKSQPRPEFVTLSQNYPNPFNPSTTINFTTTKRGEVSIKVFDLLGSEVATVQSGTLDAGGHSIMFDASKLRSGVYMYRLQAEGKSLSRRMVIMK
ncbi:MAG: T9SS type A sorting domain-containing protein [Bacteroidota bacterium]